MAFVNKDELRADIEDRKSRIAQLEQESGGQRFNEAQKDEYNRLNTEIDELEAHVSELVVREKRAEELAQRDANVERVEFQTSRPSAVRGEDIWDLSSVRRSYDDPDMEKRDLQDRALRAIDSARFPTRTQVNPKDHLERMLYTSEEDPHLRDFDKHLLYTGSPAYRRAFTKYVSNQPRTPIEDGLLSRAASLTTTAGGFAVPFVLDPTVIPTSSGAINPYRTVGDVIQITVDEWRGVSSDGITAAFAAEAAVATDAAPTLAQPTVSTEKAFAFVPFSIEIGQDWSSFSSEMGRMFADSKDILEATKFATGSGTNEPFGVITGATTVFTASNTNSLVVADIYGVHNALGPRFRRASAWTFNNAVTDRIRQLDTAGGANLWVENLQLRSAAIPNGFTDGQMGAGLLGKPAFEATGQSGTFTTGQLIGVVGDFSYYKIVDRIGLTVETIPHIFGAAQGNLPTGQRGLYAYWRVGAKVLHANAFRTLKLA